MNPKTIRMTVTRNELNLRIELYDPIDARAVAVIEADWAAVGHAISKGGLHHYPVDARLTMNDAPAEGPMHTERETQLIQCAGLPEERAARAAAIAEVLRPFELNGWRAMDPKQLGDSQRIKRQMPDGDIYAVDFIRRVPLTPAPESALTDSPF